MKPGHCFCNSNKTSSLLEFSLTLRLRGDREQRLGLQTCLEGRAGPKEKQKVSYIWLQESVRKSRFPAQVKMVDRIIYTGEVLTYIVWLFGISWRKLMKSIELLRPPHTSDSHSFRAVQPKSRSDSFDCCCVYFSFP